MEPTPQWSKALTPQTLRIHQNPIRIRMDRCAPLLQPHTLCRKRAAATDGVRLYRCHRSDRTPNRNCCYSKVCVRSMSLNPISNDVSDSSPPSSSSYPSQRRRVNPEISTSTCSTVSVALQISGRFPVSGWEQTQSRDRSDGITGSLLGITSIVYERCNDFDPTCLYRLQSTNKSRWSRQRFLSR